MEKYLPKEQIKCEYQASPNSLFEKITILFKAYGNMHQTYEPSTDQQKVNYVEHGHAMVQNVLH